MPNSKLYLTIQKGKKAPKQRLFVVSSGGSFADKHSLAKGALKVLNDIERSAHNKRRDAYLVMAG